MPELISDNAIAFGLASTLGMMNASVALPKKDYLRDWQAMPWRTSVFTTDTPRLLPPLIRRLNLTEEAGYKEKIQNVTKKGNLKDYFMTQEVPPGIVFTGAVFGYDPFVKSGQDELVIRIGLHRNGLVRLQKTEVESVRLNASTAALFGQELNVERYLLYGLQLTGFMPVKEAMQTVKSWS